MQVPLYSVQRLHISTKSFYNISKSTKFYFSKIFQSRNFNVAMKYFAIFDKNLTIFQFQWKIRNIFDIWIKKKKKKKGSLNFFQWYYRCSGQAQEIVRRRSRSLFYDDATDTRHPRGIFELVIFRRVHQLRLKRHVVKPYLCTHLPLACMSNRTRVCVCVFMCMCVYHTVEWMRSVVARKICGGHSKAQLGSLN